MPRSRGSGGARAPARAPARPMAPPPAPPKQQQRSASTAAHPPATQQQAGQGQGQRSGGSGLFGQMASTAAGVAVGSSIGHAIGGMFGGSSSAAPEQQAPPETAPTNYAGDGQYQSNSYGAARTCDADAKSFTKCMEDYGGNMQICSFYLDQLKACQQAAKQY